MKFINVLVLSGLLLWSAPAVSADTAPNCSIFQLADGFRTKLTSVEAGKDILLRAHLDAAPAVAPAQTARFVDQIAFSDAANFHYEFGFVALKAMNDIDKNLGTAFSNLGQSLLVESLDEIKRKYPQLARTYNIHSYSDFKTVRIALEPRGAETLDDALLHQIFGELTAVTQQKLKNYVTENSLDRLPIPIDAENWFVAGAGRSLDESALMARLCRGSGRELCPNGFSGFGTSSSATLRNSVFQSRNDLVQQHDQLVATLQRSGLAQAVVQADGTLRREIIEVVRKNLSDPDELAAALAPHLGVRPNQVPRDLVTSLQSYYILVDKFQPAILVRQRVRLEFPEQGGVSLDVRGMGAVNFMETEAALLRTRNSRQLADILGEIRQGERVATERFENVKGRISEALGPRFEVRCSGDDCVAALRNGQELTEMDKQIVIQRLAANNLAGEVRMTFVPSGLGRTNSMWLASQLEGLEKNLAARLVGAFTPAELRQITFAIDAPAAQGNIGVLASVQPGPGAEALIEKLQQNSGLIQRILRESTEEFEGALGAGLRVPTTNESSVVHIFTPQRVAP